MSRGEATIDDLRRVPGKAELVNGGIVRMPPTGGLPGYAGAQILASLHEYGRRTGTGHGIPDNVGFIVNLPHRKSFSPDVAFYTGELTMDFARGAPRFAVEIRSKRDHGPKAEHDIAAKRGDYFAAGTLVVWDIDLRPARRGRGGASLLKSITRTSPSRSPSRSARRVGRRLLLTKPRCQRLTRSIR